MSDNSQSSTSSSTLTLKELQQFLSEAPQLPRQKTLVGHPESVRKLLDQLPEPPTEERWSMGDPFNSLSGIRIEENKYCPKTTVRTGYYTLPDGTQVSASDVRVEDKFTIYGPEDIDLLLFMGVITEAEQPGLWLVDSDPFIAAMAADTMSRLMEENIRMMESSGLPPSCIFP